MLEHACFARLGAVSGVEMIARWHGCSRLWGLFSEGCHSVIFDTIRLDSGSEDVLKRTIVCEKEALPTLDKISDFLVIEDDSQMRGGDSRGKYI